MRRDIVMKRGRFGENGNMEDMENRVFKSRCFINVNLVIEKEKSTSYYYCKLFI